MKQYYKFLVSLFFQNKMIPCRIFLQKMEIYPESLSNNKPKISLTLNSIYYDEIKPFQTKYFCLTTQDVVGVEAVIQDSEAMVGKAQIENAYRVALQNQTVDIKIIGNHKNKAKQIRLSFLLEPVSAFKRNKYSENSQNNLRRVQNIIQQNLNHPQSRNRLQISFSPREPRDILVESNSMNLNFTRDFLQNRDTFKDPPLFSDTIKSQLQQAQSLQSLAQQRQKILGELFGRFKR